MKKNEIFLCVLIWTNLQDLFNENSKVQSHVFKNICSTLGIYSCICIENFWTDRLET